jgi:hypothetical protein
MAAFFGRLRRFDAEEPRGFRHAPAERPNNAGPGPDHSAPRRSIPALLVVWHVFVSIHRGLRRCYRGDLPARLFMNFSRLCSSLHGNLLPLSSYARRLRSAFADLSPEKNPDPT